MFFAMRGQRFGAKRWQNPATMTAPTLPPTAALACHSPSAGYAGDLSPPQAYQWWQAGEAVLIDVRTDAEREWVGFVPGALVLAWKLWPGMAMNPAFDAGLASALAEDKKALFLCRSGVRSVAAAKRATELGWQAYNILEGFEGNLDAQSHRNQQGGWRWHGLPWQQG